MARIDALYGRFNDNLPTYFAPEYIYYIGRYNAVVGRPGGVTGYILYYYHRVNHSK